MNNHLDMGCHLLHYKVFLFFFFSGGISKHHRVLYYHDGPEGYLSISLGKMYSPLCVCDF